MGALIKDIHDESGEHRAEATNPLEWRDTPLHVSNQPAKTEVGQERGEDGEELRRQERGGRRLS